MSSSTSAPQQVSLDILRSIRRIVRRVEAVSAELEATHNITIPQFLCLHAMAREGRMTQAELSRDIRLSASTLVGVIDRLEAKGLATRQRDPEDRRRIYIVPTAAGLAIQRTAPEPLQLQLERGLDGLSESERQTIAASLDRLVHLLEAQHIDAAPVLVSGPIPTPPA
jgi:DNA-binding MarR family transcriptional regulator